MTRIVTFAALSLAMIVAAQADTRVMATWYGKELAGRRTASGQVVNPKGLTAAHRSLPFGTCLVVASSSTITSSANRAMPA